MLSVSNTNVLLMPNANMLSVSNTGTNVILMSKANLLSVLNANSCLCFKAVCQGHKIKSAHLVFTFKCKALKCGLGVKFYVKIISRKTVQQTATDCYA